MVYAQLLRCCTELRLKNSPKATTFGACHTSASVPAPPNYRHSFPRLILPPADYRCGTFRRGTLSWVERYKAYLAKITNAIFRFIRLYQYRSEGWYSQATRAFHTFFCILERKNMQGNPKDTQNSPGPWPWYVLLVTGLALTGFFVTKQLQVTIEGSLVKLFSHNLAFIYYCNKTYTYMNNYG